MVRLRYAGPRYWDPYLDRYPRFVVYRIGSRDLRHGSGHELRPDLGLLRRTSWTPFCSALPKWSIAIPRTLVIVTLLLIVLEPGLQTITLALILTGWIGMSRIARAQMLKLKEQEFVLASRTLGARPRRIIFKEILPNIISQLITNTMFLDPNAIFTEAFLSFVGLGVPTPMCSLGSLINDAYKVFTVYPYQIIPPVVVLALLMMCFNMLGDGLRDAFDPKMKQM